MDRPEFDLYVGIDWGTESHEVSVVDRRGEVRAKRTVPHSGAAITDFIDWLVGFGDGPPDRIAVGIEVPRGALVEMLYDRGIAVYFLNPKQLDRFRDRHTVAGAKDDRLDAYVLADALRTDLHRFRRVKIGDALTIQLRELSRLDDELRDERSRLTNRLREQLYRFFPQMLGLCPNADETWFWQLIELVPVPTHARRLRPARIAQLLRKYRIRRVSADEVLAQLRTPPVKVAAGTLEAAQAHIQVLLPRLRLVHSQRKKNEQRLKEILEQLASADDDVRGQKNEHRDAEIILSMPGSESTSPPRCSARPPRPSRSGTTAPSAHSADRPQSRIKVASAKWSFVARRAMLASRTPCITPPASTPNAIRRPARCMPLTVNEARLTAAHCAPSVTACSMSWSRCCAPTRCMTRRARERRGIARRPSRAPWYQRSPPEATTLQRRRSWTRNLRAGPGGLRQALRPPVRA